ncbi:MAG: leucine-rich repeat protein [Tenericutes bacterium]|nr:leucine-rich repeat protein [Mycoplasmatota bacterium]
MKKIFKTLLISFGLLFLLGCQEVTTEESTTIVRHSVILYNNDETINQEHTVNHGDPFDLPMQNTDDEHIYVGWSDGETVYAGEVIVTENLELTLVQELASEVFDLGEKNMPEEIFAQRDFAAIYGYNGDALYLMIPQYIDGLPVKYIMSEAFKDSEIIEVYLPNNLETIDFFAFESCESLQSVEFYGDLLGIDERTVGTEELNTFLSENSDLCTIVSEDEEGLITYSEDCPYVSSKLEGTVILNDIEYSNYTVSFYRSSYIEYTHFVINKWAFKDCVSLETFYFPTPGMFVFFEAFYNTPKLTDIVLQDDFGAYKIIDGVVYSQDETKLIFYPGGLTSTEFTVPETVTEIVALAFTHNEFLEVINIHENIEEISYSAFYDLPALKDIFVEDENETFFDIDGVICENFRGVTLLRYPQNKAATHYTIPDIVDELGFYSFYKNQNLETIDLSDITHIYGYVFMAAEKLTILDIPNTVEMIGFYITDDSSITTVVIRRSFVTDSSITEVYGLIVRDKSAITLYLPDDSMEAYYQNRYWNYYHETIKPLSEYLEE